MASASENLANFPIRKWLNEDNLMLLECWARDGYTIQDIANRIGVHPSTLSSWRKAYPEIDEALSKGREIIDYKVENALLKSALGYKTKEVKITTIMRHGNVVETMREVTSKEQAPNVSAIQCWLFNRLPDKWKKNRDNLIELGEEDTTIHVTVTRPNQSTQETSQQDNSNNNDEEWQEEINSSIEIRNATKEEMEQKQKEKKENEKKAKKEEQNKKRPVTKVQHEQEDDLDYWPDDWEDED